MRIVIIEDNKGDIHLIKEALNQTRQEINLNIITNGLDAVSYIYSREPKPDLIAKISLLGFQSNRMYIGFDILKGCSLTKEKYNILLIEENTADYFLILESLKHLNYDVNITRVRTAAEVKSYIDSFCETTDPPRLILSEFTIPGADVYDILKTIKVHKLLCNSPFIIFTSRENLNLMSDTQILDATAFFSKPYDLDLYVETLRQIFENS